MKGLGWTLLLMAAVLAALGLLLLAADKVWFLGRLPGDIRVERPGFTFYFPFATCVVLSVVLTVVLNLILRWFR